MCVALAFKKIILFFHFGLLGLLLWGLFSRRSELGLLSSCGAWASLLMCVLNCSVMSESWGPIDYSLPGSSVHGILQARILGWVAISDPGIELRSPALQANSLPTELRGKLSFRRVFFLWSLALGRPSFSGCCSQALEHWLSSWGAWALLLLGMWDLSGSGIEPVSSVLAGKFFTTEPLRKLCLDFLKNVSISSFLVPKKVTDVRREQQLE